MLLNNNSYIKNVSSPPEKKQKGFLLLEVMLSLIIMSVGIAAVIKTYSISLRAQKHAQCHTFAFMLADRIHQEIEAAVIEDLKGREETRIGLFHWIVETEPVYAAEFEVAAVRVSWEERSIGYEISLSNLYPKEFMEELLKEGAYFGNQKFDADE